MKFLTRLHEKNPSLAYDGSGPVSMTYKPKDAKTKALLKKIEEANAAGSFRFSLPASDMTNCMWRAVYEHKFRWRSFETQVEDSDDPTKWTQRVMVELSWYPKDLCKTFQGDD